MNNLLSPLIILHVVVIALNTVLKPFGLQLPQIPLSTRQYLGWPIFFACSLLLISSTTLVFSKAWAMGVHQRQFFLEQFSPKYADAATTGEVAITFDDGWLSQYQTAVPIMDRYQEKGTFYIITGFMQAAEKRSDQGWLRTMWQFVKYYILHIEKPDERRYMSTEEVTSLADRGEEIGAHTRTHRDLTTLSSTTAYAEIKGSKDDLEAEGLSPTDFAYPSGYYTHATAQLVQEAGFASAKTADDGFDTATTSKYALLDQLVDNNTTFDDVKGWIDYAQQNNVALVLTFHQIDESGNTYAVSPTLFEHICQYLQMTGIRTETMHELVQSLGQ